MLNWVVAGIGAISLVNLLGLIVVLRHFGVTAVETTLGHNNDGLKIGERVPAPMHGLDDQGGSKVLQLPGRGMVAFVFAHPGCGGCLQLMNQLARRPVGCSIVVVSDGDPEPLAALRRLGGALEAEYITMPDSALFEAVAVAVTPFVQIAVGGRIASKGLASTRRRFDELVAMAT